MVRNVVLLSIDALRADHLSCYGYDRETTPNLDRFAEEAVLYENAFSASSHTREALPAMLTGEYPERAVDENFKLDAPTIATHLKDTHSTAAFHSNPYVSRAYGFDRHFDKFYDDLRLGQNRYIALLQRALDKFVFNRGAYHARAERINDLSLSWLDSLDDDEPFFLWNHYMDVHGPYNPPEEFNKWTNCSVTDKESQELYDRCTLNGSTISESEEELLIQLYDGEISYVDAQIERLIRGLDERDYLHDSMIIITSDHGDLFGEHEQFGHPRHPYKELTHIPLIVLSPNAKSTETINVPVSTVDISPTILECISRSDNNLSNPVLPGLGKSVEPREFVCASATGENEHSVIRRFAIFTERLGIHSEWDIETGEKVSSDEVFRRGETDISDDETSPEDGDVVEYLKEKLESHALMYLNNQLDGNESDKRLDVSERLEALGYKE